MWSREQKMLYQAFHFSPSDISSLPYPLLPGLFIGEQIICRVLDKTIYSFWNSVGCAMEREADMFSVPIRYAEKLKTGLVKLKMLVLGYPSTDPVYSLFYDHHPSLVERIRSIEQEQAATPK
ncbi:CAAX prenyl protease 1 homolog [Folsomia candida]|nr:CAAX prenyl protease 1 homolog [Folsomia candida]